MQERLLEAACWSPDNLSMCSCTQTINEKEEICCIFSIMSEAAY